jgi:hypothetical protein
MTQDTLAELRNISPTLLTDVVRKQQSSPTFDLLDWSVTPLNHEKIMDTTGGIYCFSGLGQDSAGERSWAVVLKIVNQPPGEMCQAPTEWCYWQREMLAFQSGLLAGLPGPIRAPACYGVTEREGGGWIWLEQIVEATAKHWSLADFERTATQLGRFAGAFLTGKMVPDQPWLSAPFFRTVFEDGGWWAQHMALDTPESIWQSPIVQRAFSPDLRRRVLAIWAKKERFFDALDRLPQVFCHHDSHRRNLMWRTAENGDPELIMLDWAFCGPGGVGMDIGDLVANSTYFFDSDPAQVGELERIIFAGYLAGLRHAGWAGDERLVRLGYTISAALRTGVTLPGWAAVMLDPAAGVNSIAMYGRSAEEVLAGWVALTEFLLDRADEARQLMAKL